jgi:hypothetical protein
MSTLPNATFAVNGFAYTGLAVYSAESGSDYLPVWCGEFHGTVGTGKVSDFARSLNVSRFTYLFLSDHRTGETRYVPLDFAQSRAL